MATNLQTLNSRCAAEFNYFPVPSQPLKWHFADYFGGDAEMSMFVKTGTTSASIRVRKQTLAAGRGIILALEIRTHARAGISIWANREIESGACGSPTVSASRSLFQSFFGSAAAWEQTGKEITRRRFRPNKVRVVKFTCAAACLLHLQRYTYGFSHQIHYTICPAANQSKKYLALRRDLKEQNSLILELQSLILGWWRYNIRREIFKTKKKNSFSSLHKKLGIFVGDSAAEAIVESQNVDVYWLFIWGKLLRFQIFVARACRPLFAWHTWISCNNITQVNDYSLIFFKSQNQTLNVKNYQQDSETDWLLVV